MLLQPPPLNPSLAGDSPPHSFTHSLTCAECLLGYPVMGESKNHPTPKCSLSAVPWDTDKGPQTL